MSPTWRKYQLQNTPAQGQSRSAFSTPSIVQSACCFSVTRCQSNSSLGISLGEAFHAYSLNQTALLESPFFSITWRSSSTRRKLSVLRLGGSEGGLSMPYAF